MLMRRPVIIAAAAAAASSFLLLMITVDGQATTLPSPPAAIGNCKPRERDALLAFKEGIINDPAGLLSSWRRGQLQDCCRWRGVRCSNLTGHVVKLRLRNDHADVGTALVGEIGHSLISLEHLKYLDLSMNNLAGSTGQVPEFLGSFRSMRYLNLSGIMFTGMVPPQLGNLSNLRYLDLSGVRLSGMVSFLYISDASWLAHLSNLQHLNLNGVNLSTILDWPHALNMIPSLKFLSLSSCSLQTANQSLPQLNLNELEMLDLSNNDFNHPAESSWIWNLTSLKYLDLSSTSLYGDIPQALGNMLSLQVLDFSFDDHKDSMGMSMSKNGNMGTMKANLKNLCNLEVLDLDCRLEFGNITDIFQSLPECSPNKLKEVHLAGNNLTGMLPNWIGRLTSLVTLDLFNNSITGQVPSEIGMLTNLRNLYLHFNNMNGTITEKHFAHLTSLKSIYLCYNNLKIVMDPQWLPPFKLEKAYFASIRMGPSFPRWLQSQVDIVALAMNDAGINDTFPDWFSTTFSKAKLLEIPGNRISGGLPTNMENMSLEKLYLKSNQIASLIPRMPRNLTILDLSNNSLSGPLPLNIGSTNLAELNLLSNRITGNVPQSICELQNLHGLDLSNNLLHGEFPQCSGMSMMSFFRLSNNTFSGNFPSFLQGWTELSFLDLSWNKFSGNLPTWIGNFSKLEILRLKHNMFSGNIPASITKLGNLSHLDLASNSISGPLPQYLVNLTGMVPKQYYTNEHEERLSGCDYKSLVTMKGLELEYDEENVTVVTIDLSSNLLTGVIPEDITYLHGLINLNLSRNYLSGKIPYWIGHMKSLESLDLSKNKLYGEIPQSLSDLSSLSFLNLSYNNLMGRIPSGTQLGTLYDQNQHLYDGNDGLCGPPLQKSCYKSDASEQDHLMRSKQGFDIGPFSIGVVMGIMAGLWIVFYALLFMKSWRLLTSISWTRCMMRFELPNIEKKLLLFLVSVRACLVSARDICGTEHVWHATEHYDQWLGERSFTRYVCCTIANDRNAATSAILHALAVSSATARIGDGTEAFSATKLSTSTGMFLQQNNIGEQMQYTQAQCGLQEVPLSTTMDITAQTGHPGQCYLKDEIYDMIKRLKDQYFTELTDLYNKGALHFLEIEKDSIQPSLWGKIPKYERQIIYAISSQRKKPVNTQEQQFRQSSRKITNNIPQQQQDSPGSGDWQEDLYQMRNFTVIEYLEVPKFDTNFWYLEVRKVRNLKDQYFTELSYLYNKISMKLEYVDSQMASQTLTEHYGKMKDFKINKGDILPALREKIPEYERQIISILNSQRKEPVQTQGH
uniref:non-specific serine/threonine protein kinase n=1 Tax=Oryza punctata TaxID=4537 RepID=A0A0E0MGD3_ORYPU